MPTKNKRINLTVPEPLYEKIAAFRDENGIASDAGACLQLISAQLRGLEQTKVMFEMFKKCTPEQLAQMCNNGIETFQQEVVLPSAKE